MFKGSVGRKWGRKIHMFNWIKSLNINNSWFNLLNISIYIYVKSGTTRREAALLCPPVSTSAQNMDLSGFWDFTMTSQLTMTLQLDVFLIYMYFTLQDTFSFHKYYPFFCVWIHNTITQQLSGVVQWATNVWVDKYSNWNFQIFERRLKVERLLLLHTYIGVNFMWFYVSSSTMRLQTFLLLRCFFCVRIFLCVWFDKWALNKLRKILAELINHAFMCPTK